MISIIFLKHVNYKLNNLEKLTKSLKASISFLGKFRKTSAYKYNSLLEAVSLSIENLDDFRKKLYKQLAVFLDDVGIPPKVKFFYIYQIYKIF